MMNLKYILPVFTLLFLCKFAAGQKVDDKLNKFHQQSPIEKVYLQLDRKDYFAGQTSWFKGYFIADFLPSTHNSTLFVELINNSGAIISKKVLPVFNAVTYGQIDIPDTLTTGTYYIRAYSPLMLNHSKEYLFNTSIRVYGKNVRNKNAANTEGIHLSFFPEGGNLLSGTVNNIAFKATTYDGLPVNILFNIIDNTGLTITEAKSWHDGMGTFKLTPQPQKEYFTVLNNEKIALPTIVKEGMALQINASSGNITYTTQVKGGQQFKPAYIIGQMQHKVVLKQSVSDNLSGSINTSQLHSGILQLSFFNEDGLPLAERLVFVNNMEYITDAKLQTIHTNTKARSKNEYTISFKQPIEGNFSVAVTDDAFNEPGSRKDNIISSLLLTSDIPGYVHNPAFYFSGNENTTQALDLVMLTNGWRRFKWKELAENKIPSMRYTDPGYISLSGEVNERRSKKKFAEKELMVWMATADSGRTVQLLKTDASGRFKMDSVVFFDKAKILFSDIMGKKSKFITVKLDTDSLYRTFNLPVLQLPASLNLNTSLINNMQNAYAGYLRGNGILLDNVNVEGRRLTLEELEKKYMSGLFAGNINARTINLTGQFVPQFNIFEWLTGRYPNLNINRTSQFFDDYRLMFRQQPVQLFLDEMLMPDASLISTIPPNQIALIKIYPQFIGARGNAPAIAIYTKRGNDLNEEMESFGDILDYDGYSIIKEFYSPDYSQPLDADYKDNRLTLNWQPEVIVNAANPTIPIQFYNTDRTKKFKITAEGITTDGKLLMIEQTIEN